MKAKKMFCKRVLAVLLAMMMIAAMLTACGGDTTGGDTSPEQGQEEPAPEEGAGSQVPADVTASVDFEDGACAFVKMNLLKGSPDESLISVGEFNGSKALHIENVSGKSMFVGINVSALLGDKIADLNSIVMEIGTERANGSFAAVAGYLYTYTGDKNEEAKGDSWSVYLETANPKQIVFDVSGAGFTAGADNYIIVSKETDNDAANAASLWIDNIAFLDAEGNTIEADTSVDFGSPAGFESNGVDLSNLCAITDVVEFEGFACSGDAWSQNGFDMPQEILDALVPGSVVQIEYTSENGDMWIVMPDSEAGWMRVGVGNIDGSESLPDYVNNSKNIAQITYEQIVDKCGDDVSKWGARMQCEASGAWEVYRVVVAQQAPHYAVADAVVFDGFACSGDAWSQNGFAMPQEILDALVPGSVIEVSYSSENGDMWVVFPDSTAGWMRVGDGPITGSENAQAIFDGNKSYITYEMIETLCGSDVSAWGERLQCEASGAWEVYGVRVGTATEFQMANTLVEFEGFACSGDAWAQNGFDMPQEVLDAFVPGSVVTITFTSESGNMWIVMPDSEAGWMRVGVGNTDGSASSPAACDGMTSQITYEQIVEKCGDDVSTWGARMQCESDTPWEVYSIVVGQNVK